MKKVNIYSDGSSLGNPGPGGWGAVLECGNAMKEGFGSELNTTNNRMELKGAIEALKLLKVPCEVKIVSDSKYVLDGYTKWLPKWVANNWKTSSKKSVKNKDLWQEFIKVSSMHVISVEWVKGHNGHPQNERCDELARNAAESIKGQS